MLLGGGAFLLVGEAAALHVLIKLAGVAAAIGGEAGRDLMGADDDGAGVRAALDHRADEGGNGEAPLGVHPVQRTSLEEVVDLHDPSAPIHGPPPFAVTRFPRPA